MTTVVVMPGGFHPFHAGHAALYQSARRAFPNAEVFVAATNDTSTRPFPFAIKEKLAQLAGVESGHFVQVKSPFRAEEITSRFDPEKDVLIFVRSEKDENKPPQAGGVKKDGSPAYLQKLEQVDRIEPFKKHAYMAYLPTVEFGPGMTSATEIRAAWPQLNEKRKTALVMSLYPKTQKNPRLAATVVKMLDAAIGTMSEAVMGGGIRPPPGGATAQPPGIRPPSASQPKPPPPPESDNWMAPHGDAQNEYRMFRAGEKPAVIVRGEMTQVYDPLLNTGEYPFKRLTSQGRSDAFVVGQPTEQDRVKKIHMLVQTASDRAEAGDFSAYNNSNYHRTLGRLLGYPEDKITAFVNHYFRDREDLAQTIYETGKQQKDRKQDQVLQRLTAKVDQLAQRLQEAKSQMALDEESGQMAGTPAVGGMTASYQQRENQPIDEDYVEEKWSNKYKRSINCSNPRGFSQKAHCAGRKK